MKITFIGATHEVTGSKTLIQCGGQNILVDCGMQQGIDIFENAPMPVNAADIDMVILTHAHVDHSGELPLLYKNGFRGKIFCTGATVDLCNIMLHDCAHIQQSEAEWRNRKAKRSGVEPYEPLYDLNDVTGAMRCMVRCDYDDPSLIGDGVMVCFKHVGHLMGASSVQLTLTEDGETRTIFFSGDIGNVYQPLINDSKDVCGSDYVVMESTYGDRKHHIGHDNEPDYIEQLTDYLQRTFDNGGNVIIPSFAVGRTQEILYYLRQIKEQGLVHGHDHFPVYMDSPLANEATAIFLQCEEDYLDQPTIDLIRRGINPIIFDDLKMAVESEASKAINFDQRPKVIISASGMCDAGRVRHHLKHNLWREECLILFVGYQSLGTLGRSLADGAEKVKLFGEEIEVKAEIGVLEGISGHADRDGLTRWIQSFPRKPKLVFVNHGEDNCCRAFTRMLNDELGLKAVAPFSGTVYDLMTGEPLVLTEGKPVERKKTTSRVSTAYQRLLASGERVMAVIRQSEGCSNKELAKFADQLESLCDKFLKY